MTDEQLKDLAFVGAMSDALQLREEMKGADPTARHCCDGQYCGCCGMTKRDYWKILADFDGKTEEEDRE